MKSVLEVTNGVHLRCCESGVVRRLLALHNDKTDSYEEQNAVERTYPTSPLVVFAKICGRCDFLEKHALHGFLHEKGRGLGAAA